ncbi:MAG: hypothetical protein IJV37_05425 [Bacteroidales bacterium]|nr:hypothetical protein [Bacteroidales bacterium]
MTGCEKLVQAVFAALLLATCCISFYGIGWVVGRKSVRPEIIERHDTTIIRRPIHVAAPEPASRLDLHFILLPVVVPPDSADVHPGDTLAVPVMEEMVSYENEDYRAVVAGIRPRLVSLDVWPKTIYATSESKTVVARDVRKPRISFGLTAGPGIFWDGTAIRPGLGATAGVTLTF